MGSKSSTPSSGRQAASTSVRRDLAAGEVMKRCRINSAAARPGFGDCNEPQRTINELCVVGARYVRGDGMHVLSPRPDKVTRMTASRGSVVASSRRAMAWLQRGHDAFDGVERPSGASSVYSAQPARRRGRRRD